MGGGKISSSTQYPRYISHQVCVFGLIQANDSISTLPISHFKHHEWLEEVEIGNPQHPNISNASL
eukprot:scaffold17649_cov40-Cyclotella_meneghiniana.AAC.5